MQAAIPLVRSTSHVIATSASRIPHIEYHIVRKLHRPRKSNPVHTTQRQQSRARSSAVNINLDSSWPTGTDDASLGPEHEPAAHTTELPATATPASRYHSIDFNSNHIPNHVVSPGFVDLSSSAHTISAQDLLQEASPERLLTWLASHPAGHAFTVAATPQEFDQAFCALDPTVLVDPYVRAKKHLGRAIDVDWELSFRRSLVRRLRLFATEIDTILIRRQEFGAQLTLNTCRHALRCAASVGDVKVADHIWNKLMTGAGIEPDLLCYNAYLHAHSWNLAHSEIARTSFRNTKRNLALRSQRQRPRSLIGYSVSSQSPEPDWVLRARTLALFQEISSKGLVTDEATFVNLIVGFGRSADLAGVTSILKSVWNIDVDALDAYDEEELESPTYYPDSHPLRPTSSLLLAVVHAYAINHKVGKAWNLLDYISRNYALSIPDHVWDELVEWTFVLSISRSKAKRDQGQAEGKIHVREVENLFLTLTDEPHNVRPTPLVLDLLVRSYRKRGMLDQCLAILREAEKDMMGRLHELRLMVDTIKAMLSDPQGIIDNGMLSQKFISFRNDFQLAYLAIRQQYALLILETKRILSETDFAGSGKESAWSTQRLPQIVEEFEQYLPNFCKYKTRTGHVSLRTGEHRDEAQDVGSVRSLLLEANTIWETLDTLDLFKMAGNLQHLAGRLQELRAHRRGAADPLGSERVD